MDVDERPCHEQKHGGSENRPVVIAQRIGRERSLPEPGGAQDADDDLEAREPEGSRMHPLPPAGPIPVVTPVCLCRIYPL